MGEIKTIRVLCAFCPYMRMLQAYKYANFWNISNSRKVRRIAYSICITIRVMAVPFVIILGLWHLIECDIDIREFSTYFALVVVYTQLLFLFVVMMIKNKEISAGVERIQRIVDKREFFDARVIKYNSFGNIALMTLNFVWGKCLF